METQVVGTIKFDNTLLDVYSSLDEPLFKAIDISKIINYGYGNTWNLCKLCEEDEKLILPVIVAGQKRPVTFVTEHGLYNILAQSRQPIARKWRRVVHDELINLRKARNLNVLEQFSDWDGALDAIYFDEETGVMMQSVTVAGGDVEQIPFNL